MRIDLNFGNVESLQPNTARRVNEDAKGANCSNKQDAAVLSVGDSTVSKLTASALASPEIRTDRVSDLRNSIGNGTYSTKPTAIADALLNSLF